MGFNNIELITDRTLEVNLRQEIRQVKREFPDRALVVSLMVETKREACTTSSSGSKTPATGLELNFRCPHGMSRARTAAGQVPI